MLKRTAIAMLGLASLLLPCRAEDAGTELIVSDPVEVSTPAPEAPAPAVAAPAAAPAETSAVEPVEESAPAQVAEPVVIDYNEADIQSVMRTLATRAGVNLIMGDEVTGKVTVHLENVSYDDAMHLIVESKGFAYVKDRNVVRIKTKESLEAEPLEVRIQTLNYAKADDVRKTLEPVLTKRGKIQVDARSNTLIFSDAPSNLAKILPLVENLDTQTPQVLIEAKFVETTKNPKKDIGINWSDTLLNHQVQFRRPDPNSPVASPGGPTTPNPNPFEFYKDLDGGPWSHSVAILDPGEVKVVLSFLNSDSDTELLANPRVVTTDNGRAKIAIATQYPIPNFQFSEQSGAFQISGFEYKDIGIVLNVLPRINKNNYVTLEVAPEASSQSGVATLASGGSSVEIPIIDARQTLTTVLIKSGNTLAIGGLMRQDTSDNYTKVPVMGDIPGIGALFRSKSLNKRKRDLLIFLTPTIVLPDSKTGYEEYYDGMPPEELYTNDRFLPKDNAKPKSQNLKGLVPFSKAAQ